MHARKVAIETEEEEGAPEAPAAPESGVKEDSDSDSE
jgi:hypothetical protein